MIIISFIKTSGRSDGQDPSGQLLYKYCTFTMYLQGSDGIAHKLHCVGTFLLVRLTCFDFYKLKLIKQYKLLLLLQSDDRWPLSDVKNLWLPR